MGASLGGGGGPVADMNLTPLIDIVLVVLIIMMVNIPIQIQEMTVKLPSTEKPPEQVDPPTDQLVIAVYSDGRVALNRTLMEEQKMFFEITRRLRPMATKRVFVDAAQDVPYGRVVDMVDLAREAGAAQVGLARMKDAGPLEPTGVAPGGAPRGVVKGSVNCIGGLGEVAADPVVDPILPNIRACYDQALARKPDTTGRITIRTVLGPQGEFMEDPSVEASEVNDQELVDCVGALLPQLHYPPLGEGKTAICRHPFLLSPG